MHFLTRPAPKKLWALKCSQMIIVSIACRGFKFHLSKSLQSVEVNGYTYTYDVEYLVSECAFQSLLLSKYRFSFNSNSLMYAAAFEDMRFAISYVTVLR